ncbi:MAG TPA: SRPBCC family protein [Solirubrobacteraceae bacterium]|nr:SRPBCC family protein [Solirubrobacteraceae bacterium]
MGILEGDSTAEIDAPLERVWTLVSDVERGPQWQGGLKSLVAIERDGEDHVLVADTETDAKLRTLKSQVRFRYEPPTRLTWEQTVGELKSISGSWILEDLGDGRTRARYWVGVDLGPLGLLIRGPIVDMLREQLAGARANELKAAIEGDA